MKKIATQIIACTLIVLTLFSCSKNDDKKTEETNLIIGKWIFSKKGSIVNGQEVLTDYNHTSGCSKDYLEIKADGTGSYYFYESNVSPCLLSTPDNFTWVKKDNNNYTFTDAPDSSNIEILSLTANELKIKFSNGEIETFVK
jgi:Lipocalin-like domain